MSKDSPRLSEFTSLLIDVQTRPERDTSLETLAAEHGVSPFHFHRTFTAAVGETPRRSSTGCGWSGRPIAWR